MIADNLVKAARVHACSLASYSTCVNCWMHGLLGCMHEWAGITREGGRQGGGGGGGGGTIMMLLACVGPSVASETVRS